MSGNVAAEQLQSFVRRIESVEDEINALNSDKSEIYKEAKGDGFDVKVLRKLIADRRKDASERAEFETIYELYAAALGMRLYHADEPVRAHVEIIEEFPVEHDADGVFPDDEPQPETAVQGGTEPANPVASRPIQPETANEASGDDGRAGLDAADHGLVEAGNDAVSSNAGGSNVVDTSAHIVAGEGAHNAPVTPFTPKPLRPHCLRPERCAGQGRQHCWSCTQSMNQGKVA